MAYRWLTDLADAARKSGLDVVEIDGWKTRGRPAYTGGFNPRGSLSHHTGGHGTNTRAEELEYVKRVLVNGYANLPGPLCQLALGRQTVDGPPVVYVVAAGRANHAGTTRAVAFVYAGDGNSQMLGTEAVNSGFEGWQPEQLDAYHRLTAAINDHYRWPRDHTLAHAETSTAGKWDPGINGRVIDMHSFRRAVASVRLGVPAKAAAAPPPPIQEDDMPIPVVLVHKGKKHRYGVAAGHIAHCASMAAWAALVKMSPVDAREYNADEFVHGVLATCGIPAHFVRGDNGHVFDPEKGEFRRGGVWSWQREAAVAVRPARKGMNREGTLAAEVGELTGLLDGTEELV